MSDRRSESRLSVHLPGTFCVAGQAQRTMFFSQISSRGCCLSAEDAALAPGAAVELHLGPVGPIGGIVRWVNGDAAGIEFTAAIEPAIVSYFAAFISDAA